MDMQNVSNLVIPEGDVRTIHDKDSRLLWGKLSYDTKYMGDSSQNGTPTPDAPVNVNIVTGTQAVAVTGKNLFDISKVVTNAQVTNNGDGALTITTSSSSSSVTAGEPNKLSDYCPTLKVGDTVTLSFTTTGTNPWIYLYGTGANILWGISAGSRTKTITQAMLDARVLWYASGVATTATISDIQLELGSSVSAYEPYQGHSYAVNLGSTELCKIGNYQDYIYKSGSDWYVHKEIGKIVFTGSETWTKFATSGMVSFYTNVPSGTGLSVVSNYFSNEYTISFPDLGGVYYSGNSNKNMLFRMLDDTTITEASDFKTWLGTHNTTVYYQLATPTDTKITDATLIAQLDVVHQFLTRYGYNGTVSGDLPIIIDRTNL